MKHITFVFKAFPVEGMRCWSRFTFDTEKEARKELTRCKRAQTDWKGHVRPFGKDEKMKGYTLYRVETAEVKP